MHPDKQRENTPPPPSGETRIDSNAQTSEEGDGDARAFTADRAVAPLAIEDAVEEVVLAWEAGDRREVGGALAGAVVAMVVYRYKRYLW